MFLFLILLFGAVYLETCVCPPGVVAKSVWVDDLRVGVGMLSSFLYVSYVCDGEITFGEQ